MRSKAKTTTPHLRFLLLVFTVSLTFVACSSEPESEKVAAPPKGGDPVAAFSGVDKADKAAFKWQDDAKLYAIASPAPQVDKAGRSPAWLYTYVSKSAGTVASVTVADGEAEIAPEQELPEDQVREISSNTLPPPSKLKDSNEAIEDAGKVRDVLAQKEDAQVTAGLDSFSSESPVWIFSTTQGEERVEQKVPAS